MFLPISVFVLNTFLAIFQFLLVGALASIIAIYSRHGGDYANSIRWTYHGGYMDMLTCLLKSYKKVPTSVSIILITTIIASFLSGTADLGASHFIHPATRYTNGPVFNVNTTQRCSICALCLGWSTWSYNERNVTEAMTNVINNTINLPDRVARRIYKPKTSLYEQGCNDFGLKLSGRYDYIQNNTMSLSNGSCGDIIVDMNQLARFTFNNTSVVISNISLDRWSIRFIPSFQFNPTTMMPNSQDLSAFGFNNTINYCYIQNPPSLTEDYRSQLVDVPKTYTRNCLMLNRTIAFLSRSFIHFNIELEVGYPEAKIISGYENIFKESDELLISMTRSINIYKKGLVDSKGVKDNPAPIQLMEIRKNGSSVEMLICVYVEVSVGFECLYNIFKVITRELENSTISHYANDYNISLPGFMSDYSNGSGETHMAIDHIPLNDSDRKISISMLRNKTFEVVDYMASIGPSLIVFGLDFGLVIGGDNNGRVYLEFETMDPEDGFEIPSWLVILVSVIMVCCACLWAMTELLLNARYTSSLYKMITMELTPRIISTFPMLVKAKVDPFEVEGILIASGSASERYEMDTNKSDTALFQNSLTSLESL